MSTAADQTSRRQAPGSLASRCSYSSERYTVRCVVRCIVRIAWFARIKHRASSHVRARRRPAWASLCPQGGDGSRTIYISGGAGARTRASGGREGERVASEGSGCRLGLQDWVAVSRCGESVCAVCAGLRRAASHPRQRQRRATNRGAIKRAGRNGVRATGQAMAHDAVAAGWPCMRCGNAVLLTAGPTAGPTPH